jgi:hypothetical protein
MPVSPKAYVRDGGIVHLVAVDGLALDLQGTR